MKLTDERRKELFEQARALSPELGDLFQNPMDLTEDDILAEIDRYYRKKNEEHRRWETYKWTLGEMLCFPEQAKGLTP